MQITPPPQVCTQHLVALIYQSLLLFLDSKHLIRVIICKGGLSLGHVGAV